MSSADICAHGSPGCGPIGEDTGIRADPNHCDGPSKAKSTYGRVCSGCHDFTCLNHLKDRKCRKCRSGAKAVHPESISNIEFKPTARPRGRKGISVPPEPRKRATSQKNAKAARLAGLAKWRATQPKKAEVTDAIVKQVIKILKKPQKGVGVTSEAKRLNVEPGKLSAALKAAGFVVKKGRKK